MALNPATIKFQEPVWHDQPYSHAQRQTPMPKDFFDRRDEKEKALALLRSDARTPLIVKGERRSGKTSLAKLLLDQLVSEPGRQYLTVFVNWQGFFSRDELAREILRHVCDGLNADLVEGDPLWGLMDEYASISPFQFMKALKLLLRPYPTYVVVICIDEFDSLLQQDEVSIQEKEKILGLAVALIESTDLPIKLVLTLTRIPEAPEMRPSPLIAKSVQIHLRPFGRADFDEMVDCLLDHQITLGEGDRQRLFELAGGWPFFGKAILIGLAEQSSDAPSIDRAVVAALPTLEPILEHIYQHHFSDAEKTIMLLLALCNGSVTAKEMTVIGRTLRTAAAELAQRDFLRHDDASGDSYLAIGLLVTWFERWVKFDKEIAKYLPKVLKQIKQLEDPFAGTSPRVLTDERLRRFGL